MVHVSVLSKYLTFLVNPLDDVQWYDVKYPFRVFQLNSLFYHCIFMLIEKTASEGMTLTNFIVSHNMYTRQKRKWYTLKNANIFILHISLIDMHIF